MLGFRNGKGPQVASRDLTVLKDVATPSDQLDEAIWRLQSLVNWERRDRTSPERAWRLDPILDILRRLDDPQENFKAIHVAGTKGKGSVCSLVEQGLDAAGLNVGRYASPHVESFTERLSIQGRSVERDAFGAALLAALDAHHAAVTGKTPGAAATWFDIVTAGAFLALARAHIAWAVVECGLGGRLDSTNVVKGRVAIITNIDLEHTEVLGTTAGAIAAEKVGILKPGTSLVTAVPRDSEAGAVIRARAEALGCTCVWVKNAEDHSIAASNVRLARAALDRLGEELEPAPGMRTGRISGALLGPSVIAGSALPGRLEWLELPAVRPNAGPAAAARTTTVVLDGAHVPSSLARVLSDIASEGLPQGPCVVVIGMHRDKDAPRMMAALTGFTDTVITTQIADDGRSHGAHELADLARGTAGTVIEEPTPEKALQLARRMTAAGGWILVTGSLYLVGKARANFLSPLADVP